jgi:hypothetical protein
MSNNVYKLIYLNLETGEQGKLPDFGIISAGGVSGPTFTVGGKALLFSDGTSTGGTSGALNLTLQGAYDSSSAIAQIALTPGKNLVINPLNNKFFSVNAETGKVTISGDLEVLGNSAVIEGTISNLDQLVVNPPVGSSTAVIIEPQLGVTMTSNIVTVRNVHGGQPVFTIDAGGNTSLKNLSVGLVNGVDVLSLYNAFTAHLSGTGIKHTASEISVDVTLQNISGSTVSQALTSIDSQLSSVKTYEHIQTLAAKVWTVQHNKNSMRPTVSIFGVDNVQVLPDELLIVDANTIKISFNTPFSGRALVLMF